MRVIAGIYKGRRLGAPRGVATRPTSDRVREAVFSILGDVGGLHVLDLYAGSGALAIEALSRGAECATLVDSDARAARAARENLERLGEERGRVERSSVPTFLRAAAARGQRWDLAFCDPPYRLAHRLAPELGRLLVPVLSREARVVNESSIKMPLDLGLPVAVERRYGETLIVVHRLTAEVGT